MADYAVGDIQGCYGALMALVEKIQFDPEQDRLWIAGDMVSRGEDSLAVLRYIKSLGDAAVCVLGNHDISLIAMHYGLIKPHPSLKKLLKAPDRDELIQWLCQQPMMQVDDDRKVCMTHAGLPPKWTVEEAKTYALEIQQMLQADGIAEWLGHVYGDKPRKWKKSLQGYDRHRYILNAFTRMRFLKNSGGLTFKYKLSPKFHKKHIAWFDYPKRKNKDYCIIFGHWASLGFYQGNRVIGLDTGCVWGGSLSAINLDGISKDMAPISVKCNRAK